MKDSNILNLIQRDFFHLSAVLGCYSVSGNIFAGCSSRISDNRSEPITNWVAIYVLSVIGAPLYICKLQGTAILRDGLGNKLQIHITEIGIGADSRNGP